MIHLLKNSNWETVVAIALGVIGLIFGYLTFSTTVDQLGTAKGEPIGEFVALQNSVKTKASGAATWTHAEGDDLLHVDDQIFTHSDAVARVRLADGAELVVSENSLVKVHKRGNQTEIDLNRGFLSGSTPQGGAGLRINFGDTKVDLGRTGSVQVDIDPTTGSPVAVLQGDLEVTKDNQVMRLKPSEVLKVDRSSGELEIEQTQVRLLSPRTGEVLYKEPAAATTFQWESTKAFPYYELVIAEDRRFSRTIRRVKTQQRRWSDSDLPEGSYYWKVVTAEGNSDHGAGFFSISWLTPPNLILPEPDATFAAATKSEPIYFSWTSKDADVEFEVFNRQRNILGETVQGQSSTTVDLSAGTYRWRVKEAGDDRPWSRLRTFTIGQKVQDQRDTGGQMPGLVREDDPRGEIASDAEEIQTPPLEPPRFKRKIEIELRAPNNDHAAHQKSWRNQLLWLPLKVLDLLATEATAAPARPRFTIEGSSSDQADGYMLQLADDPEFTELIISERSERPVVIWREAIPGRYYLRGASLGSNGERSSFSPTSEIVATYEAPELISPIGDVEASASLAFQWQYIDPKTRYRLEVADEPTFYNPIVQANVATPRFVLTEALPAGQYYWRVWSKNRPPLPWKLGLPATFRLQNRDLLPPKLIDPADKTKIDTPVAKTQIRFAWHDIPEASGYELQVAADDEFSRHESYDTNDPYSTVLLDQGVWYWRVRSRSQTPTPYTSPWSHPQRFSVQRSLVAPIWITPSKNLTYRYFQTPPQVSLSWQGVENATAYQWELKPKDSKASLRKLTSTSTALELDPGIYRVRVRAVGHRAGDHDSPVLGPWGEARVMRVFRHSITAPHLVSPTHDKTYSSGSRPRLKWQKQKGFQSYKVVIAKDEDLSEVITAEKFRKSRNYYAANDLGSGTYYWYVEGRNRKENLALRSQIQRFSISEYNQPQKERVRILAGYAPSFITNRLTTSEVDNSLKITALNSFVIEGTFWPTKDTGADIMYHRKSAVLFSDAEPGDRQQPLTFSPQDLMLRATYRVALSSAPGALEIYAKGGYAYKTFYGYFQDSLFSIALTEVVTHNASIGGALMYPLDDRRYFEGSATYNHPLQSSGSEVTSGYQVLADGFLYFRSPIRLALGAGYRYGLASYSFSDPDNDVSGQLFETTHSVLGNIGYGF